MKKNILMLVFLALAITTNAQQPAPPRPPMGQGPRDGRGPRGGRGPMGKEGRGEDKEKIEMFKIQFITKKLALTSSEAELFWPVYEAHKKAMKEIVESKTHDEIQLQEATLNARKKYKNDLKPVLKSDERVNEALKIEREFLQKIRHEMMRRKGFQA
jgi:hypothetical protein